MRLLLTSMAVLALMACNKTADTTTENAAIENMAMDANAMDANAMDANAMAMPAAFQINGTSWEYINAKTKKPVTESVDAAGNYVTWAGAEHVDHGSVVMKDGKACFTSAMTKDGEECWTDPKLEIGASGETVSDKGEKLAIKRVAFVAVPDNVKP